MINLEKFICDHITLRQISMFLCDIDNNKYILSEKIKNKSILVIGGAGSIGSSFIKSILPFCPKTLVVIDINENALAELTRSLRSTDEFYLPDDYIPYPIDYSSNIFEKIFRSRKGFDIVANFAAHKHVRSEKDTYSIEVLLRNNVVNAMGLLNLLSEFPPEEYFCVSTDKAANPVNIMGASKRIMEDLIFSYSDIFPVKTARFANVAFSNGSLPYGFLSRIQNLQPLSAPYDVKRYFVSPEESGQICMLSCVLGNNREIFFPKLIRSQMTRFDIIAIELLKEFGYKVIQCQSEQEAILKSKKLKSGSKEYPVFFSESDTSGEKSFEEFYTASEEVEQNKFSGLGIVVNKPMPDKRYVQKFVEELDVAFKNDVKKIDIVMLIQQYLPEFKYLEKGKSLDNKM